MRYLVLFFVVVPLVELSLLLWIGDLMGLWPTVALTIVTGVVGGALAKREGLRVLTEWRASLERLEPPSTGLVQGMLVLIGGAFLLTPGVLTDVTGLLLLIPVTRRPIARWMLKRVDRYIATRSVVMDIGGGSGPKRRPPDVIDTTGSGLD